MMIKIVGLDNIAVSVFVAILVERQIENLGRVGLSMWIIPGETKRVDSLIKLCLEVVVHQVVIRQVLPVGHLNNYLHICLTDKVAI